MYNEGRENPYQEYTMHKHILSAVIYGKFEGKSYTLILRREKIMPILNVGFCFRDQAVISNIINYTWDDTESIFYVSLEEIKMTGYPAKELGNRCEEKGWTVTVPC
jgi:hypothetical protein